MGVPANANPLLLASQDTGYRVSRSLRFNGSVDSSYLSRTPASAGNRKTWTFAFWWKNTVKSTGLQRPFLVGQAASPAKDYFTKLNTGDGNTLSFNSRQLSDAFVVTTTQVFRDPSAWYHIALAVDTTQATASNRVKIFVNGVQVTAFSTASYPSQNLDIAYINESGASHFIGRYLDNTYEYLDSYLADIHFCDGTAYDASAFGEFDATTGVWVPKAFSGLYGTNGWKLEFADNSAATATTLGKDTSGNGNNWTPNNLSVTAGAGNDSLVDVPTNGAQTDTGVGGEVRGNYATANPLDQTVGNGIVLSNGNLDLTLANGNVRGTIAIPSSGKWYFEWTITKFYTDGTGSLGISGGVVKVGTTAFCGVTPTTNNPYDAGGIYKNGSKVETVTGMSVGDVFGITVNMDALTLQAYRNGSTYGSSITIDSALYIPRFAGNGNNTGDANTASLNFGQRPFAYTAPSGFKALCTANLPAPVVTKPSTVMDVKLYTGNGSTQTVSGLGFSPDLVWIKARSAAYNHDLTDSVRGATKSLYTSLTQGEATDAGITSFNSDGFSIGGNANVNFSNTQTCVAWAWDAGSSTVTNTSGSITSSVRANASAGFSIVTYSGNNSDNQTVGHGLGAAPELIIVKIRNASGLGWIVGTKALGWTKYLSLQSTAAEATSPAFFGNTAPTSTVFTVSHVSNGSTNGLNNNYVAYCFAPVSGYSSMGSYVGNGSTDGSFIYCGFRPRLILTKRTDSTGDWIIHDTARSTSNVAQNILFPNRSDQENSFGVFNIMDILSNGFKFRLTGDPNTSNGTFVYAAFAESPFQYARAR